MATAKQKADDVMAKINGIMTALRIYPDLFAEDGTLSLNLSFSPINLLVDFFKTTRGYDWLVNAIAQFISYSLPALEVGVKGVLLSNIQNMLSCSIKPIITQEMINEGVVFDLNKIDLFNMFSYSPLDKSDNNPGKYYYFGCDPEDGIEILDDVKSSRDLNAVLWYAKNTPGERIVWRREMDLNKPFQQKQKSIGGLSWFKQVKSNGIATIEFNHRSSEVSNSENASILFKEPINNCVHVFIGCCAPVTNSDTIDAEISAYTRNISELEDLATEVDRLDEEVKKQRDTNLQTGTENGFSGTDLNKIEVDASKDLDTLNKVRHAINGVDVETGESGKNINQILDSLTINLNSIHETLTIDSTFGNTNLIKMKNEKVELIHEREEGRVEYYPTPISNYYYLHPLFEWNTDFIMSVKLFDEKVVTAQLLDALTNCLDFTGEFGTNGNISVNLQAKFVEAQLRELVTKMIQTDDGTVSDCFFSFTNDSYNALLNEVELAKAGLETLDGTTINEVPSAEDIMSGLNSLSSDASKEEIQSVVAGSLFNAASSTTPRGGDFDFGVGIDSVLGFNTNMSIIDQLLTKLVYVIVSIIMQPKVYILLMTNLAILGGEPNFDLLKFIQQFKNLIADLIREIKDQILEYFRQKMMEILEELIKKLAVELSVEQYRYYVDLLLHCIECFKLHMNEYDWAQDDVNYADITQLIQENNEEC